MKILYHHRTLGDGAEGIHIREMVRAFQELGHEVVLTGPAEGKTDNKKFSILKKWVRGPFYELMEIAYNFIGFLNLARAIRRHRPDLIYDRYILYNLSCVAAGKVFNLPVITEINAPLAYERLVEPDEVLYFPKIAEFAERQVAKKSFRTIVVSTPLKEYFIKKEVSIDKIFVLPNGVNTSAFSLHSTPIQNLKKKYNIGQTNQVIGFTGILRPWHGIDLLLDAVSLVKKSIPDITLLLVGDGPGLEGIKTQISTLNLDDTVIITGRIPHHQVPDYITLFDVAVSPKTTFYASPMKIPEYMILKKCIIAPDTSNIRDLLINRETGLLFKPGDAQSLAKAMEMALKRDDLRNELAEKAYRQAVHHMSWQKNAQKVLNLIE